MTKHEPLTTETLNVPGVEVFQEPPVGSKHFAGPFYADEHEKLRDMLRGMRRREGFGVVAIGAIHSIYRFSRK